MAILRPQEPTKDFTKSARTWVRDPALSAKAKGLLTYIASHSPTYELSVEQIVAEMRDDERSVRSGIKELETCGYLRRQRRRDGSGKLGGYDWQVIDFPDVFAGHDQEAETQSGSEQGEHDETAGHDHTAEQPTGPDLQEQGVSAGQDHTAKPQPGREQGKDGVSAGGDHTAKRRTKETKETNVEDKEKTMERSEVERTTSGRFAPSGADHTQDDQLEPLTLHPPTPRSKGFTDWRDEDYDRFLVALGSEEVICVGGVAGKPGTYPARALYDGMLKMPDGAKDWPGKYLEGVHARDPVNGITKWLERYGLEVE
jgi:hypothetical protein